MATLSLTMLGAVALQLDGQPVRFARRSGLALAIYLACAGRAQSRSVLATLLAGESDEASAAMALRNALRDLRAVLGDELQVDTRSVALAATLELASDVTTFEAVAQAGLAQRSFSVLREAVACYGGEFVPGLSLKGAPGFDDWRLHERERLHDRYLRVLEQLAAAEERAGDRKNAIASTRRLLAAEPWHEEAHRRLIRLLAADGQRAAALVQFEQCRATLQRELGVEPQAETLALVEQIQAGPVAPPHNLPARPTSFVDRPAERALLAEQLQCPDCRLVTIVGIGGAGKTRLALELATEFIRPALPTALAFPDGVFLVTCGEADQASSPSAPLLALALIRSLNLPVTLGANPEDVLLRWLASRTMLLIIDNAESDPTVASFARAVLAAAPHVRLLITSRVRLRLEAERVFDVGGLSLPTCVDDLASSEAGQLFLERARAVRLRRQPGLSDYPHIVRICRLVSGLPLGIVLAAGRLRGLSCAEVAEHLAGDLGLLVSEAPDLPERQRNLSAVLRWSYRQLRPDEARCLRLLSVLRGSFDSQAARAVSGCEVALLEVLADYGLLTWGDERFSLHPLVHHIAAEEITRAPDERAQAEQRHAYCFAELAARLSDLAGQDDGALQELATHWENLVAAWSWTIAHRRVPYVRQLRSALARVWDALGLFREGISACEGAAAALGRRTAPVAIAPDQAAEVAELLLATAWFHSRLAESERAAALLEEGRLFAARSGSAALLERLDRQQGMQLYLQTRYRLDALQRALGLGAPLLECLALLGRGRVALLGSEHPRALALADEALRLARAEGVQHLIPRASVVRGQAQAGLGDDRAAAESFTQALECDLAFAHSAQVAADAVALAAIRQAQGDGAGAIGLIAPQLTLLLSGALTGMDEPMRTLLSAAETLRAAGDPRAEQLVARAERELARRAELVQPERRDAFLCAAYRVAAPV